MKSEIEFQKFMIGMWICLAFLNIFNLYITARVGVFNGFAAFGLVMSVFCAVMRYQKLKELQPDTDSDEEII